MNNSMTSSEGGGDVISLPSSLFFLRPPFSSSCFCFPRSLLSVLCSPSYSFSPFPFLSHLFSSFHFSFASFVPVHLTLSFPPPPLLLRFVPLHLPPSSRVVAFVFTLSVIVVPVVGVAELIVLCRSAVHAGKWVNTCPHFGRTFGIVEGSKEVREFRRKKLLRVSTIFFFFFLEFAGVLSKEQRKVCKMFWGC